MKKIALYLIGKLLVANRDALIARSLRTPYSHLNGYMNRYWLVPYKWNNAKEGCFVAEWDKNPMIWAIQKMGFAIRIHHILREDWAADLHDHPWDFRTFILKGQYSEMRLLKDYAFSEEILSALSPYMCETKHIQVAEQLIRQEGDSATINFGEFHKIDSVSPGGVWTLFISRKYQGTWGFLVNGEKIPHVQYQGRN